MMRQAIAREAARLMIEHGHEDYGFAKRKAAERFGVTDLAVLPKNTEIEEALAEHQRLFVPEAHASELSAMRSSRARGDAAPRGVRAAPGRAAAVRHRHGAQRHHAAPVLRTRRRPSPCA